MRSETRKTVREATAAASIVRWYARATPAEVEQGHSWYQRAHDTLAFHPRAAAVCAVLSPMVRWESNLDQTRALFHEQEGDRDLKGFSAFPCNVSKARAIRDASSPDEIDDLVSGPKVRAFWALLLDPDDPEAVCLDSIAIHVALGIEPTPFTASNDVKCWMDRPKALRAMREGYRLAARALGLRPSQVQAVTWLVWRGERDRF